jgi:hypothetical protein
MLSSNITSFDSRWSIPVARSIIKEHNVDLDEYKDLLEQNQYYQIKIINNHYYSYFPIGTSIMAVPFVFIFDKTLEPTIKLFPIIDSIITNRSHDPINNIDVIALHQGIELFIASFIMALTSLIIYLIALQYLNKKQALIILILFAFGTSVWSVASRALWQHGPTMLMLSLALYLAIIAKNKPYLISYLGLVLGFSFIIRPTNLLSILFFTIYIFFSYRKYFVKYLFYMCLMIIPFVIFSVSTYNSILPPYYSTGRIGTNSYFLEALFANLFSPARGLFIFSPFLLFAFYGIYLKIKNHKFNGIDFTIILIIVSHWLVVSAHGQWWAGHSFGPRFMSDMIPYLIYLLIPAIPIIFKIDRIQNIITLSIFILLSLISIYIHYKGANDWETMKWNTSPNNIDINNNRIWDWKDLQFLR